MSDLAQDLANKLGLKVRKAYISPQTESTATEGENHGETSPPTGEVCGRRFNLWSKTADSVVNFIFGGVKYTDCVQTVKMQYGMSA